MPGKANNWALVDLSGSNEGATLYVLVAGTRIPVAKFSMTYGLNAIPTATALVALGRDARTQEESAVYKVVDQIKQMAKVEVILAGPLGDWSTSGEDFPNSGPSTIFVGYVAGMSYRRSSGRVSLVLNMINQLIDLDMSSGGSRDVVPGSPGDLMTPTLTQGAGGEAAGSAGTKFVLQLSEDLNADFSIGILNTLMFLAENNQLQTHESSIWCAGYVPGPGSGKTANKTAARAMQGVGKWEGIANLAGGRAKDYSEDYPLLVHSPGVEAAAKTIGEIVADSLASTSMWNMLIGALLPEFGCGIVPLANGAIIAPILNNAREHQLTIPPEEYVDFDMTTLSKRPLYGVAVVGNYQFGSVSVGEQKRCVGATFIARSEDDIPFNDGMWLFVNAPRWMDDWTNLDPQAIKGEADVNKMLTTPSHDNTGASAPAVVREPESEVSGWNAAMEKFAKLVYANNALQGRHGTLVGKLRFDVAPGITIKVKSRGEAVSEGVDSLACDMIAFVARVTINIDAEQSSASTTLELTNIRTDAENQLGDRFSMDSHPFFNSAYFKYAPIVPTLSLAPKT